MVQINTNQVHVYPVGNSHAPVLDYSLNNIKGILPDQAVMETKMKNQTTTPSDQLIGDFNQLALGYINTQLLLICAKLKLPELLETGPKSLQTLAEKTDCDSNALKRFLRGLCAIKVLERVDENSYEKTPLLAGVNGMLTPGFGETSYQAWENAMVTVKTGKPAWQQTFGQSFYDYLDSHPQHSHDFDRWNANSTGCMDPLISRYNFGQFKTLIDLGGGQGNFMLKVLAQFETVQGTIFDREEVITKTAQTIRCTSKISAELANRIQLQAGSFFDSIPPGADAYSLCRVLLNWNDEQVLDILKRCVEAMNKTSRLLILDFFIAEPGHPSHAFSVANDLNLMVAFGGGSRSSEQWHDLVARAGLTVQSLVSTPPSPAFLLEAVVDE